MCFEAGGAQNYWHKMPGTRPGRLRVARRRSPVCLALPRQNKRMHARPSAGATGHFQARVGNRGQGFGGRASGAGASAARPWSRCLAWLHGSPGMARDRPSLSLPTCPLVVTGSPKSACKASGAIDGPRLAGCRPLRIGCLAHAADQAMCRKSRPALVDRQARAKSRSLWQALGHLQPCLYLDLYPIEETAITQPVWREDEAAIAWRAWRFAPIGHFDKHLMHGRALAAK